MVEITGGEFVREGEKRVEAGGRVDWDAVAFSGWEFNHWVAYRNGTQLDWRSTNPGVHVASVNSNWHLEAHFSRVSIAGFTVSASAHPGNDAGMVEITGGEFVRDGEKRAEAGERVDWDAVAFSGWEFSHWVAYRDGAQLNWRGTNPGVHVLSVNSNWHLEAHFTANESATLDDPSIRSRVAEMYAPVLHFAEGENYLPAPVEVMEEHAAYLYRIKVLSDRTLRNPLGDLDFLTGGDENTYLDINEGGSGFFADSLYHDVWWSRASGNYPLVVYARVASGAELENVHPDFVVVQYWFFYLFNDGGNNHEGDWEGIQLIFANTVAEVLAGVAPYMLHYAHHHSGTLWAGCEDEWNGRPDVYVALGSHASYRLAGDYPTSVWGYDDDAHGDGTTLQPIQYEVRLLDDQSWLDWPGRWGSLGARDDLSGPTGPKQKARWSDPFAGDSEYKQCS